MEKSSVTEWVASNVRRERQHRGWGLAELSQRVTGAGHPLSLKTLSKIETGLRGIDVEDLRALALTLAVPVDELLTDPSLREVKHLNELLANYRAAGDRWLSTKRVERELAGELDVMLGYLRDYVKAHPDSGPALDQALDLWLGPRDHETDGWRRRQLEVILFGDAELADKDGAAK